MLVQSHGRKDHQAAGQLSSSLSCCREWEVTGKQLSRVWLSGGSPRFFLSLLGINCMSGWPVFMVNKCCFYSKALLVSPYSVGLCVLELVMSQFSLLKLLGSAERWVLDSGGKRVL